MNSIFHAILPKKALSAVMYKLSRIETPWFSQAAINAFMKVTGANLTDAKRTDVKDYRSLLDFFTRELAPNARPIASGDYVVASPVDGCVAHVGDIENEQIFQIKGHSYSLAQLVGDDMVAPYRHGQATTIYLAPYDYHRIHAPLAGTLTQAKYIPGELNSVSITLLDKIAGLFAKNERVVLAFETADGMPFLMVLVGAVNVGSIETVFHGEICPNDFSEPLTLPTQSQTVEKGEEIGRFNLGSTVIFITPKDALTWQIADAQSLQLGEAIGTRTTATGSGSHTSEVAHGE